MQPYQQPGPLENAQQAPAEPTRPEAGEEVCVPAEFPQEDEANLEFRPVVKYAGIGVLLALLVGIEYAT